MINLTVIKMNFCKCSEFVIQGIFNYPWYFFFNKTSEFVLVGLHNSHDEKGNILTC